MNTKLAHIRRSLGTRKRRGVCSGLQAPGRVVCALSGENFYMASGESDGLVGTGLRAGA
jgi:hypothetical protein